MIEDDVKLLIDSKGEEITELAKIGYTNARIAEMIGIKSSDFNKLVKTNETFAQLIKDGQRKGSCEVKRALLRLATGYKHKDIKTYVRQQNGQQVTYQEITEKEIAPNISAIQTYLRLFDEGYSDMDNFTKKLKERELKIKEKLQDIREENWI